MVTEIVDLLEQNDPVSDSMMKYVQCEPRRVTVVYSSVTLRKHFDLMGKEKSDMELKIKMRDAGVKRHKWEANDWFAMNQYNPQLLAKKIITHGCTHIELAGSCRPQR